MGWGGYPAVPRLSLLAEPLSSAGVAQSTIDEAAALLAGALLGRGTVVGCAPVSQDGANTVELLIKGVSEGGKRGGEGGCDSYKGAWEGGGVV